MGDPEGPPIERGLAERLDFRTTSDGTSFRPERSRVP